MKTCIHCKGTAFDDMVVCYGCMHPFEDDAVEMADTALGGTDEDIDIEEPFAGGGLLGEKRLTAEDNKPVPLINSVRLHVSVPDMFGYDIYLLKEEGVELTIGCARDNNIVLPHAEARRHVLKLSYSQGKVWIEDKGSQQKALIGKTPLSGTRALSQGSIIQIGEARIELINE